MTPLAGTRALWYLTRGSGAVSLLLLTLSVVLGIATSTRWATARLPRFVVERLHRNVALLATVLVGLHVVTTVVDGYVPIRWLDAVVPFGSAYRPLWMGLGAVALDLFVAVIVTSLLRVWIGLRLWRAVHWLAYACWPVALAHSLGTGSDNRQTWMLVLDAVVILSVLAAVWWRLGPAGTAPGVAGAARRPAVAARAGRRSP